MHTSFRESDLFFAVGPNVGECIASVLLRQLDSLQTIPVWLRGTLIRSITRLLDSSMLIEDPLLPFSGLPGNTTSMPLPPAPHLAPLEKVIESIANDGFSKHFFSLMFAFGKTMISLVGSEAQVCQVEAWSDAGLRFAFFMTDRGGPSMQKDWLSCYEPGVENDRVIVDKIWGIDGVNSQFAVIAAKQAGHLAPVLLLVPPEVYPQLNRNAVGLPYLDGTLQLGNIAGTATLPKGCVLGNRGLMGVKHYMLLARPRFVRGLCAHIEWLARQQRAVLSAPYVESLEYVRSVAEQLSAERQFNRQSEDRVLALKFAMNELMLQLVESGSVFALMDQRDLLGFSKMEGSSYRCFYEMYTRSKGARDAG